MQALGAVAVAAAAQGAQQGKSDQDTMMKGGTPSGAGPGLSSLVPQVEAKMPTDKAPPVPTRSGMSGLQSQEQAPNASGQGVNGVAFPSPGGMYNGVATGQGTGATNNQGVSATNVPGSAETAQQPGLLSSLIASGKEGLKDSVKKAATLKAGKNAYDPQQYAQDLFGMGGGNKMY